MRKLKVIIADDEHDALEVLSNILKDSGKVSVLELVSNSKKIESLVNKHQPDVLFLDIEMPGTNGMELLINLREYNHELKIIVVTAYDNYVSEAIKYNVYSYLLKPVDRQDLHNIIDKLALQKETATRSSDNRLKLPVSDGYIFLEPSDILMLKADGNYTKILKIDNSCYTSSYNMGRILERLPADQFLRINRACILNANYLQRINKVDHTCIACVDNVEQELDISQSFITAFNKKY